MRYYVFDHPHLWSRHIIQNLSKKVNPILSIIYIAKFICWLFFTIIFLFLCWYCHICHNPNFVVFILSQTPAKSKNQFFIHAPVFIHTHFLWQNQQNKFLSNFFKLLHFSCFPDPFLPIQFRRFAHGFGGVFPCFYPSDSPFSHLYDPFLPLRPLSFPKTKSRGISPWTLS